MLLTEARALELVTEWTKDCACLMPLPPTEAIFTYSRVVIEGVYNDKDIDEVKALALSLRRAMEGLNALACCAGFEPEENPAFWRRNVWRGASGDQVQRLSSSLFSRYYVADMDPSAVSSTRMAWGLALCISMDPASPASEVRREVAAQLQGCLLTQPPPLDLVVGSPLSTRSHSSFRSFLDTVNDLARVQRLLSTTQETVKVVIGQSQFPLPLDSSVPTVEARRDLIEAIDQDHVKVIEIRGRRRMEPDYGYSSRDVIDALSGADTVEYMAWQFDEVDRVDAVRLSSAVAYMRSLKTMKVNRGVFQSNHACEWLAFALKRRQQGGLRAVELSMLAPASSDAFVRAMRHKETFGCLIPEDLRRMLNFEYFPLGTSAEPKQGAVLTQELLMGSRHLFARGGRLDVLASAGSKSIVVVPASGLMWVRTDDLSNMETRPSEIPASVPYALRTLAFSKLQFSEILSEVQDFDTDANVVAISIKDCQDKITSDDMLTVLSSCPVLRSLDVPGFDLPSLMSLLNDSVARRWTITALDIGSVNEPTHMSSPNPIFDTITGTRQPIARVLKDLSVASVELDAGGLELLVTTLTTNRRLRFIRLRSSASKVALARSQKQMAIAIGPTDRSKVWLYACLLSVRRSGRWLLLPCNCQQLMVEFATVQTRRQVVFIDE